MALPRQDIAHLLEEIDRYLSGLKHTGATQVREGFAKWSKGQIRVVEPATLLLGAHLAAALANMKDRGLAKAIERASPWLKWRPYSLYPRAEIGAAFADGHAFASLIGEDACIEAENFDLGLFIIEPKVLYTDHHHAAPELYAPLTGPHAWRFLPDEDFRWIGADVPIWNEPWAPHATQAGDVPFLCIFCWTADVNTPAKVIPGRGADFRKGPRSGLRNH